MTRSRVLSLVLMAMATPASAAASGLALVACDKGSGAGQAPAASASAPAASDAGAVPSASGPAVPSASARAAPPAPPRRHVGLAGILLKSAYDLTLTDDQKAQLDQADARLYPDGARSPWTAVRAFQADLVDGIRHDKIDMTKIRADEADLDRAVAAGLAAEADALDTLHGALDAATRQALVDAVKAKGAAGQERGGRDAGLPLPAADAGVVDWSKHRLDRLSSELGLDDTQQKQAAPLVARGAATSSPAAIQARREAMQKRVDALLAAFPKDSFDAKKVDLSGPAGRSPHDRLDEAAVFAAGLLPILRIGQIARFAEQTERAGMRPERIIEDVGRALPPAGP
jgi:hypothetical protein